LKLTVGKRTMEELLWRKMELRVSTFSGNGVSYTAVEINVTFE